MQIAITNHFLLHSLYQFIMNMKSTYLLYSCYHHHHLTEKPKSFSWTEKHKKYWENTIWSPSNQRLQVAKQSSKKELSGHHIISSFCCCSGFLFLWQWRTDVMIINMSSIIRMEPPIATERITISEKEAEKTQISSYHTWFSVTSLHVCVEKWCLCVPACLPVETTRRRTWPTLPWTSGGFHTWQLNVPLNWNDTFLSTIDASRPWVSPAHSTFLLKRPSWFGTGFSW